MIGIIVATHGDFAKGLVQACSMFAGDMECVCCLGLDPGKSIDSFREEMEREMDALDEGDGILVLTDILGGSPFNCAFLLQNERHVKVVTGVNLPMLMSALEIRGSRSLEEVASECVACAIEQIQGT